MILLLVSQGYYREIWSKLLHNVQKYIGIFISFYCSFIDMMGLTISKYFLTFMIFARMHKTLVYQSSFFLWAGQMENSMFPSFMRYVHVFLNLSHAIDKSKRFRSKCLNLWPSGTSWVGEQRDFSFCVICRRKVWIFVLRSQHHSFIVFQMCMLIVYLVTRTDSYNAIFLWWYSYQGHF